MSSKKTFIAPLAAILITAITLTAITAAMLNTQETAPASETTIQSLGRRGEAVNNNGGGYLISENLEIYKDPATTIHYTTLDWGTLKPGDYATKTIYLKNTSNNTETLKMTTTSWIPESASTILTLTWNREGDTLAPGAVVSATLTLHVAPDTGSLSTFSLRTVISGSA